MVMKDRERENVNGDCLQTTPGSQDLGRLCMTCATHGRTCCQGRDIYVTHGDCGRIVRHGVTQAFYEYRGCCHAAYAEQDNDPVWQRYVFRRDGSRRVLKSGNNGDCFFLSATGCLLPLTVRPLICRLYPHVYSADGITGAWDSECPSARAQAGPMVEQGIAGVQRQEAVLWHRMLYSEILLEVSFNENWPDV